MFLSTLIIDSNTEWTQEELLEFQNILQKELSTEICLDETEEILTRLYDCFAMVMDE